MEDTSLSIFRRYTTHTGCMNFRILRVTTIMHTSGTANRSTQVNAGKYMCNTNTRNSHCSVFTLQVSAVCVTNTGELAIKIFRMAMKLYSARTGYSRRHSRSIHFTLNISDTACIERNFTSILQKTRHRYVGSTGSSYLRQGGSRDINFCMVIGYRYSLLVVN